MAEEAKAPQASEQDIAKFISLAKLLGGTVRKTSLYFIDHPFVKESFKQLQDVLQEIFSARKEINFGLIEGKIIIENINLSERAGQMIALLEGTFKNLQIESLTIYTGVTELEMQDFIVLMSDPQKTVKDGGLSQLLKNKNVSHVIVNQSTFVQMKKGEFISNAPSPDKPKRRSRPTVIGSGTGTGTGGFGPGGGTGTGGSGTGTGTGTGHGSGLGPGLGSGLGSGLGTGLGPGLGGDMESIVKKAGRMKRISYDEYKELVAKANHFDETVQHKVREAVNEMIEDKKKLVREKEKTERILRSISDGLMVVDKEGKVVFMNEAAEKMLGKPRDQMAGKHIIDNLDEHQVASFTKDSSLPEQGDKVEEIIVHGLENTRKILRASSAIIEDTNGMTVGTVSVLSDVTKQRELDALKDKFVAHVSHELRSPLTIIKGAVLTVKDKIAGELNPEQEELLKDAGDGISRLERLINDLLDIAKIESGRMELKLAPVNINELIQKVVDSSQLWAKSKKLELKAIAGTIPETQADPDKITQIIMNLISNAIKFTPEQGHINITTMIKPEENSIYISVRDSGVGIAKDNLHKVFQKFQQFGVGRGGSGLGLFICKELVEMHGGTIVIESDLGQGTTFIFTIPVK